VQPCELSCCVPFDTASTPQCGCLIPPEVIAGSRTLLGMVDAYAAGAVLYWMLTGDELFPDRDELVRRTEALERRIEHGERGLASAVVMLINGLIDVSVRKRTAPKQALLSMWCAGPRAGAGGGTTALGRRATRRAGSILAFGKRSLSFGTLPASPVPRAAGLEERRMTEVFRDSPLVMPPDSASDEGGFDGF